MLVKKENYDYNIPQTFNNLKRIFFLKPYKDIYLSFDILTSITPLPMVLKHVLLMAFLGGREGGSI